MQAYNLNCIFYADDNKVYIAIYFSKHYGELN